MKALVKAYHKPGIWLRDVKIPEIKPNEVLIKVRKTAICGTDIHIYNWDSWAEKNVPVPLVTGHEFFGEIVEIGSMVKGLAVGDLVSGEGHIVCGMCRNCRTGAQHLCLKTQGIGIQLPGCFAEYMALPAYNVIPIPRDIPDHIAAILDPLGNAVHCALTYPLAGENVLITGAGPIGIMAALIAKFVGAKKVLLTDVSTYRLQLAQKLGITNAINVQTQSIEEASRELDIKDGFAIGMEMSGNISAFNDLIKAMHPNGKVLLLGIPPKNMAIDWNQVIFKGLTIKGIYGRKMFKTWYQMISLIQSGLSVEGIITHQFNFENYEEAFKLMAEGQTGKVILNWF